MMTSSPINGKEHLLAILDEIGQGSWFLWTIFLFTLTQSIFNGMQSMSYVFTTEAPDNWCAVPELTAANWTQEEIVTVSSESSCGIYNYNYTQFAQIGYEETLKHIEALGYKPESSPCTSYIYQDIKRTTIVEEWDLVCAGVADRANTYMALSVGKLVGAGFGGIFADRYGRKIICVIGILMLVVVGPLTALVPWFWAYLVLRFFTVTETSGSKHRQWMGVAFNIGYPLGTILLSGIAYLIPDWRNLQFAVSAPALMLLFHAWFMPESPRWLISQNRCLKAQKVIGKNYRLKNSSAKSASISSANLEIPEKTEDSSDKKVLVEDEGFISGNLKNLKLLFSNSELTKRAFIMYFSWMTSSLCYYAIALNVENFAVDHYLYVFVMGLTEIPSYVMPSGLLMIIGRRQAGALLFTIGGIFLLCILTIPQGSTASILGIALTGRFALSAVYGVIMLHTSELFPTVVRNSAVGTSSVMAHVGTIAAPYVAELLGQVSWWAPTTLCGIVSLIAGFFCLALPETRHNPLADTVEQECTEERDKVSLRRIVRC